MLRGVASAALAAFILVGCSPAEEDGPDLESQSDQQEGNDQEEVAEPGALGEIGESLEVSSKVGENPSFVWPDEDPTPELDVTVLHEGDGSKVEKGSTVLADYAGYVWQQAEPFDSSFDRGAPTSFSLNSVVEGWSEGIPGHTIGSRLLISVPPEQGYGASGNPSAGIGGEDTIVFIVDILGAFDADSQGEEDAEKVDLPSDLPITIDGELGEKVSLTIDDNAPEPSEPAAYPISVGSGADVGQGDTVVVSYILVSWDNEIEESTWSDQLGESAGPIEVVVGQGTALDLVEGSTVGSRVLMEHVASADMPAFAIVADILAAY